MEKLAVRKRHIKQAVSAVSEALGNTPTVCRKYYIHAGLLDSYIDGQLPQQFSRYRPQSRRSLGRDEQILAWFLQRCPQAGD